jgi:hypothetical protein
MKKNVLLFAFLAFTLLGVAQTDNPTIQENKYRLDNLDYKIHKSSRLVLENQFMNRVVYSGRDYGLKGFGTVNQLTYHDKSGFWLSAVGYYWDGSKNKFPKADISVGYALALDERLSASFGYSRWFYFGKSADELRWVFSDFLSTYWTIDLGIMGLSPSFYYQVGKTENVAQFALTASKYKELRKPFLGGKLIFEPNFTWMVSSRDQYFAAEPTKPSGKVVRVINYEAVLPITYRRVGAFDFSPQLHWTMPVNVLSYDGADEGKPFFYFTANLKVLLWHK